MIVMVANNSSCYAKQLMKSYPGKVGWLLNIEGYRSPEQLQIPYALDNGAFSAWKNGTTWDENAWIALLEKASRLSYKPLFAIVPDVVADAKQTIESWERYHSIVKDYGYATAFAVQDGMVPGDVPDNTDYIFVGGTQKWKWRNAENFIQCKKPIHVGRINTRRGLEWAANFAASCDGTGFFRGGHNGDNAIALQNYLDGIVDPQLRLPLCVY